MAIPFIGDVIREIGQTVRQVIPDPKAQKEFELKVMELADKADARETELIQGQIDINKEEAKHSNLFVAGWRPFIGWVGGIALGWTWIGAPLFNWTALIFGKELPVPALHPDAIYPVILALLGIGGMRSFDKFNGVATSMGGKVLTPVKRAEVKPVAAPAPALDIDESKAVMQPIPNPTDESAPKKRRWFNS